MKVKRATDATLLFQDGKVARRINDLRGHRFGRLVATRPLRIDCVGSHALPVWECVCNCKNTHQVRAQTLAAGTVTSCGCLRRESYEAMATQSRLSSSPEYNSWRSMRARCLNPKHEAYKRYAGRGIRIDPSWLDFKTFLRDMGPRPPGTTLERKNNSYGYSPSNCVWLPREQQNKNTRQNVTYTLRGETMCQRDWARRLGIHPKTLVSRVKRWGVERALTTPKLKRRAS